MTITGKFNNYGKLVKGQFERGFLFSAVTFQIDKEHVVALQTETRIQLVWWTLTLFCLALVTNLELEKLVNSNENLNWIVV